MSQAGEYQIVTEKQRRLPDEETIASIRARYPVEAEHDAVYSRKMRRRHGPGYQGVTLDLLVEGSKALIESEVGGAVSIENARWLSGGASKLQVLFELVWRGENGAGERRDTMVLRMEPAASVTESSRNREFEVLRAVEGIIPAPKPYWVDADAKYLPYPAMIYDFVTGAAKPSYDSGKVSGLGQNFGPELRTKLAPDFVRMLAALHTIDVSSLDGLEHFERPEVGSNASVIRQVNAYRRVWEEDRVEEEPLLEVVYRWLVQNAPPLDHVSIVHGDYRSGNFLFDEDAGRITAWLDWEGATLGDRHQDLTYAGMPSFSHFAEDDSTLLASGMMSEPDLYAAYEKASGLPVDPARLAYYQIFNRYLLCVLTLAASARASRIGGTHQDVLVNYVVGVGYVGLADLHEAFLEEVR
ncbi:phosphotransferase family protein [Altererythrobacter sp. BO-6]|uniref:phosphotransferase family protein n=1 Tax=Altererythrobacter sp. BO-6 TaxID=2604537 RepID=UPI0019CF5163|nr:phosphotransferase family protein [Altererythrobacter sp. BO-6]